tara:strand:- start:131 stop:757 length:627 start_codon:yes stop_codon:yes gene_type:complete
MFTGIITEKGMISRFETSNNILRVMISVNSEFVKNLECGASVSVEGVCLTVVDVSPSSVITFEIIPETVNTTTLASLMVEGKKVNLERSLKMGDEIGGHVLSGHICSTAKILEKIDTEENMDILLKIDPNWMKYVLPKGYIALDGISLTVGSTNNEKCTCWIHLIPETLSRTTLASKLVGDLINVEIDNQTQAIIDTVERIMKNKEEV